MTTLRKLRGAASAFAISSYKTIALVMAFSKSESDNDSFSPCAFE